MRNRVILRLFAVLFAMTLAVAGTEAAQKKIKEIDIDVDLEDLMMNGFIPVSLTGFTGETKSVLTFDLEIAGFNIVSENRAAFVIKGKNSDTLEGRVVNSSDKTVLAKN